ncbi:hypothetical protein JXO59_12295 [candidate division KSB1 bacterium]|nr:hypothetical protein [candidate division KSB1 bacterium]
MNSLTNFLHILFQQLLGRDSKVERKLNTKKLFEKRKNALMNHIGDKNVVLAQCNKIDLCECEDEMIDLLAKASILMEIDPSFRTEFERLQESPHISRESKMILKRIEKDQV